MFFWGGGSWGGDSGERGGKSGGGGFAGELRGSCGVDSGVVMREGGGCWGKGEGVEERESMYMKKNEKK